MLNGIRRMDPVSERARRTVRDGETERYALAIARGDVPSVAEMEAPALGYGKALTATLSRTAVVARRAAAARRMRCRVLGRRSGMHLERRARRAALAALIAALPARQRDVVVEHYAGGSSLRAIGRHMAISPQRASQLHLAALAKLRAGTRVLRRIDPDEGAAGAMRMPAERPAATGGSGGCRSRTRYQALPHDHPRWVRDADRDFQSRSRTGYPVHAGGRSVVSLWDHRLRCIVVGGRRVQVDASGSYRADA